MRVNKRLTYYHFKTHLPQRHSARRIELRSDPCAQFFSCTDRGVEVVGVSDPLSYHLLLRADGWAGTESQVLESDWPSLLINTRLPDPFTCINLRKSCGTYMFTETLPDSFRRTHACCVDGCCRESITYSLIHTLKQSCFCRFSLPVKNKKINK